MGSWIPDQVRDDSVSVIAAHEPQSMAPHCCLRSRWDPPPDLVRDRLLKSGMTAVVTQANLSLLIQ